MKIQITRADETANIGTPSRVPGILSIENFLSMDDAVKSLCARGIPVTEENKKEFMSHSDTQFTWTEFVNVGVSAYRAKISYDIREILD